MLHIILPLPNWHFTADGGWANTAN